MDKNTLGYVRSAVDSDIPVIESWLKQYSGVDTLAMNWNITLKIYSEKGMLVYEDAATKEAVAYFWGSLNSTSSILEVRPDHRGNGIGQALVSYLLNMAVNAGEGLLRIECAPESSEEFWRAMGFDIERHRHQLFGKRILPIPRPLPLPADPIEVIVRFFPEQAMHKEASVRAFVEYHPVAVKDQNGTVWLNEKLAYFDSPEQDLVIELTLDGKTVYRNKAKYKEAEALGVIKCDNGYAIEKITLPL